ncbi:hypothetical protein V6N13_065450 [Hibiscus sabdariffa]
MHFCSNLIVSPDALVKGYSVDILEELWNYSLPLEAGDDLVWTVTDEEIKNVFVQCNDKAWRIVGPALPCPALMLLLRFHPSLTLLLLQHLVSLLLPWYGTQNF